MKRWLEDWWLACRGTWRLVRTRQLVETLEWMDAQQRAKGR